MGALTVLGVGLAVNELRWELAPGYVASLACGWWDGPDRGTLPLEDMVPIAETLEPVRRRRAMQGIVVGLADQLASVGGAGRRAEHAGEVGRVLVVDECRQSGNVSEAIAAALLDDDEHLLQEAILAGPPPLGHGAAPLERVRAFARAYTEFLDRNVDLLLAADRGAPAARHRSGAYACWLAHLRGVLAADGGGVYPADAGTGTGHDGDAEGAAHAVLALLDPRRDAEIATALSDLAAHGNAAKLPKTIVAKH